MNLAIFDLDNTLLAGDSDYLWGQFMVEQGLVDGGTYERENRRFYEAYQAGSLDIREFLRFSLRPLREHGAERLTALRSRFVDDKILPIIPTATRELLALHRARGDELLIITATNRFITEPIAAELGVEKLVATDPEIIDGHYTGEIAGIPCFQAGKVARLHAWLEADGRRFTRTWFYSDSHNDLPLLEEVDCPVAVDPDESLREAARAHGWPVISLREGATGVDSFAAATAS